MVIRSYKSEPRKCLHFIQQEQGTPSQRRVVDK